MELADQIVLINNGTIEQIGAPEDLYDRPSSPFVMSFLGQTTQLGDVLVRPHDIEVLADAVPGTHQAMIERVLGLGFHSRIDAVLADGSTVTVQLTRAHAQQLEIRVGDIVFLRRMPGTAMVPAQYCEDANLG